MMNKIDIALLSAICTDSEVEKACKLAISSGAYSLSIPPYFVKDASEYLNESNVKLATVIGYPMGYSATPAKVEEIKRALDEEVDELSAVVNGCAIRNGNWKYVKNDISSMTNAVHLKGKKIAIAIDNEVLSEEELEKTCQICIDNEVNTIQISISKSNSSSALAQMQEIKKLLPASISLKVSVNSNDPEVAQRIIELGADFVVMKANLD